jgi:hypothetical protein
MQSLVQWREGGLTEDIRGLDNLPSAAEGMGAGEGDDLLVAKAHAVEHLPPPHVSQAVAKT